MLKKTMKGVLLLFRHSIFLELSARLISENLQSMEWRDQIIAK